MPFEIFSMNYVRLETDRLLMREWQEGDLKPFAEMGQDPDVMRYFPKQMSQEDAKQFIAKSNLFLQQKGFTLWATTVKESGQFAGFVGLAEPSYQTHFTPCVEIGWRLAKRFWGHGYATEAAKRVLKYAFEDLNLPEIVSFTSVLNAPSMKVMERIGMSRDTGGDFDHPKIPQDHPLCRHVLYRIKKQNSVVG
jgi:RimJ/RimL family protein N-acetyltransferase